MGCISSREDSPVPPAPQVPPPFDFSSYTYDNTSPFQPTFTTGKCVKVYDGDTLHIVGEIAGKPYRFTCRMYGYDSPELRTKNVEEKKAGYAAKAFFEKRVLGKVVSVHIHPIKEKYGRLLVTLSDSEGEINKWMIENKHGLPYFGGTKEKPFEDTIEIV